MRRLPPRAAACLLALLAILPAAPALAAWTTSANVVADASSDELHGAGFGATQTVLAPDATGGVYVAYLLAANADSVELQRLDGDTGARAWATAVTVNSGGNGNSPPRVVADGVGGCWVVWEDSRAGASGIYAQRVDADGSLRGPVGGMQVAGVEGTSNPFGPAIAVAQSADRLLVAFWRTAGLGMEIQRVRIQGNGFLPSLELPGGVQITTDTGSPSATPLQLFSDGTGGGIVTWSSNRASLPGAVGYSRVLASRFNSAGAAQWGANGLVVMAAAGVTAGDHRAFWTGTDLHVAFSQDGANAGIRAQRVTGAGALSWGTSALGARVMQWVDTPFDQNASTVMQPRVASDGGTGMWVAWVDGRHFTQPAPNGFQHAQDLYVQHLDVGGAALLATDGAPADTTPGTVSQMQAVLGGSGGLHLVFKSFLFEAGSLGDVYTRRIAANGTAASAQVLNKSSFSTDDEEQDVPMVVADGFGGFFAAWDDNRNDPDRDVYATRRSATGTLGGPTITLTFPNGGESLHGLVPVDVTWTSTLPPTANVKLEHVVGALRTTIVTATPNDGSFSWSPPSISHSGFRVVISEAGDNLPADSSNAAFSVCAPLSIPGSYGPTPVPNDVALADLDEDGILDYVVPGSAGLYVARGLGAAGVGNGGFAAPATVSFGTSARDVAIADFDADGILDLAGTTNTGVTIARGNGAGGVGNGTFTVSGSFPTGSNVRGIAAADLDENGITDLIAVNGGSNSIAVLLGNGAGGAGNGTFAAAVTYAVGASPSRCVVGDFDEDGIWDVAVTNNGGNTVSVLEGNGVNRGDGTFGAADSYAASAPLGIATGDFDEDGITDLAIAISTGIAVRLGNGPGSTGDGTFAAAVNYGSSSARDVVVADWNGDGRADVLAAEGTGDRARIYFGDGAGTTGDGTFTVGGTELMGDQPTQIALGDLLEDNRVDALVANGLGDDLYPCLNECSSALSGAITVITPNGQEFFVAGTNVVLTWSKGAGVLFVDVEVSYDNGANWRTIARRLTGTSFDWTVAPPQVVNQALIRVRDSDLHNRSDRSNFAFTISNSHVLVIAPNGGQSFRGFDAVAIGWGSTYGDLMRIEFTVNGGPRQLISAGTPDDGSFLWSVPNVDAATAKVFVTADDGSFADSSDAPFSICRRASDPTAFTAGAGGGAQRMAAGDFDEDGIEDLVVSNGIDLEVLRGLGAAGVGNGAFGAPTLVAGSTGIHDLTVADLDQDGILDVLVATSVGIRVYRGLGAGGVGNGTFAAFTTPIAGSMRGVEVADFDEDGLLDVAVSGTSLNRVQIHLAQGSGGIPNGTFTPTAAVSLSGVPGADLVVADFDRDGIWDLAESVGTSIAVMLGQGVGGNGDGTLAPAVLYPSGLTAISGMVTGDFDGEDGVPDLAAAGGGAVSVLTAQHPGGVPDGTFSAANVSAIAAGVASDLALVDFDFNEFPDLAVAGQAGNRLGLLPNDSGGGFGEQGSIPLPSAPFALLAGDFNEDGAHDVIASANATGNVHVVLGFLCGAAPGSVTLTDPPPAPHGAQASGPDGRMLAAWPIGSEQTIQWTKSPNVHTVDLAVSRDGGANWRTLGNDLTGTSFAWTVTPPQAAGVQLRVSVADAPGRSDVSVTPVTITNGTVDAAPGARPATAAFSSARPNPARGAVAFELALPGESDVHVEVFDVSGRRVASLVDGRLAAGYHPVRWTPSAGAAGAGLYFVRARWTGFDVTRTVVRVE